LAIFSNYFLHTGVFVGANCVYYVLYHFEWSFFEKYKANDYPWPWNDDKEFWSSMTKKVVLTVGFNNTVLTLIILSMDVIVTGKTKLETSLEMYPSSSEIVL